MDPREVRPRDVGRCRDSGTGAEEYGIESPIQEVVDPPIIPDSCVVYEFHPKSLQVVEAGVHQGMSHLEAGNPVPHHPSAIRPLIEDSDRMSLPGEELCDSQPRRPGSHHRNPTAGGRTLLQVPAEVLSVPIRHKGLDAANGHRRLSLLQVGTGTLTLNQLRTDPRADIREVAGLLEYPGRGLEFAVLHLPEGQRNIVVEGTRLHTRSGGTMNTPRRLLHGPLGVPRQVDLVEVLDPLRRSLHGHAG